MLRALSDRIIPGLPTNIKILLVSQVENDLSANQQDQQSESSNEPISVLQAVKESDKVRARAEKEFNGKLEQKCNDFLDTLSDALFNHISGLCL